MENIFVYIGTYTSEGGEGIYISRMDPESGRLERIGKVTNILNPSFFTVDSRQCNPYAVNEISFSAGEKAAP
ncbi:MAG: beta-propeller fold lactonase family protein [Candidatus Bathyarchaeia archaeon]